MKPEPKTIAAMLASGDSSLLDLVDNVINKGIVLNADVVLGVANVDLIYLRLSALLCAADRIFEPEERPRTASEKKTSRAPLAPPRPRVMGSAPSRGAPAFGAPGIGAPSRGTPKGLVPSARRGTPSAKHGIPSSKHGVPSDKHGTPSAKHGAPVANQGAGAPRVVAPRRPPPATPRRGKPLAAAPRAVPRGAPRPRSPRRPPSMSRRKGTRG